MMPAERYGNFAILLHWLIAALIVANIGLAWSLDNFDHHDPIRPRLLAIHKSIGMTVLVLAAFRLAWRWLHPVPALPETLPRWQRIGALTTHGVLYALLFVMPVSGLIDAAAFTEPVDYFFLFKLPTIIPHNEPLGHAAFAVHQAAALLLYALLLAHAAAALFHHYWLKDGILRRMLP
jgi:cytochrome b561